MTKIKYYKLLINWTKFSFPILTSKEASISLENKMVPSWLGSAIFKISSIGILNSSFGFKKSIKSSKLSFLNYFCQNSIIFFIKIFE